MTSWLFLLLFLSGFYPWIRAWFNLRKTSLAHAPLWTILAWLGWAPVFADPQANPAWQYLALCLAACAGVAVLGARRPHLAAWNLVVAGLLAVMVLPLMESLFRSLDLPAHLGPVRMFFLAGTLLVAIGNYLPTRLWPAAALCGLGLCGEMLSLFGVETPEAVTPAAHLALLLVPWAGWACMIWRGRSPDELTRCWLDFRDRFGALWSLRVGEQFNHAAEHAGWPVRMTWSGPTISNGVRDEKQAAEMLADFQALLKRFVAQE